VYLTAGVHFQAKLRIFLFASTSNFLFGNGGYFPRVNKNDEVIGEWRKLHSEDLHNLYSSPDVIREIKRRRMRWAGQWHA
jgi:hypothetical protein